MEEKQLRVEALLKKCSGAELEKIAGGLKMDEGTYQGQNKDVVFRRIQAVLDAIRDDNELHRKMLEIMPMAPEEILDELMTILMKSPKTEATSEGSAAVSDDKVLACTSKLRREFKILGTIGGEQEDQLTYISLLSQVQEGKKKGYTTLEIAGAVKKACSPATTLRTYFDSKLELPLESIISFIRSYLREKSSTELFQDLNSVIQLESETALNFVLRAMELREKVKMASDAENSFKYGRDLVQSLFLHAIRTGLLDDSVKSRMESLLKPEADTTDEVLIEQLNAASAEETERKKKRVNRHEKKCVTIAEASINLPDTNIQLQELMNPLMATVKSMTDEIRGLKEELNTMKSKGNSRTFSKRGCGFCKKKGKESTCRHCWNCGAGDHLSFDCPKKASN